MLGLPTQVLRVTILSDLTHGINVRSVIRRTKYATAALYLNGARPDASSKLARGTVDHGFFLSAQAWTDWGLRMSPNLTLISDRKKFMWDGCFYATREEAARAQTAYLIDNFEARVVEEEGKFLTYTRRVVKEVGVTTQ